jgi:hypothetical protein
MYACTENNEQVTDKVLTKLVEDVTTENCDEKINAISGDIVGDTIVGDEVCEPEEITGIRFSADVYVENYLYIGDSWRITTNNKGKTKKLIFEYTDDGINWNTAFPLIRGRQFTD